jgi:hypothetical protein
MTSKQQQQSYDEDEYEEEYEEYTGYEDGGACMGQA